MTIIAFIVLGIACLIACFVGGHFQAFRQAISNFAQKRE